jgi:hypothetical protein
MRPKSKSCDFCHRLADCSLVLVISTLGVSPRIQQCSESISLCKRCIQQLCDSDVAQSTSKLREVLKNAYTAIKRAFSERSQDTSASRD